MKYAIENTKAVLKDFSYVEKLKINIINSFGFTSKKKMFVLSNQVSIQETLSRRLQCLNKKNLSG
jgi:hypothetical protein